MPAFHAPTGVPVMTGYEYVGSAPTPARLQPSTSDFVGDDFAAQTTFPADQSAEWGPFPTDDRNRPEYGGTVAPAETYGTAISSLPTSIHKDSVNTAGLVGITVAAGLVGFTILFAIIWWVRGKKRTGCVFGIRSRRKPTTGGEEEKPPTYEAAVFGIYHKDGQSPFPPPVHQQALQSPPYTYHIHSPQPFDATTSNTLGRSSPPDTPHQPANIMIYPHDSLPHPEHNTSPIRPTSQANLNRGSDPTLPSHHITDFSNDYPYPDVASIDGEPVGEREAVVREIV